MQKQRTFKQKLILFLKGLVMGVANKVPGVSGGTVSFVLSGRGLFGIVCDRGCAGK